MKEWYEGGMDGLMDGRTYESKDGQIDGRGMTGWKDGRWLCERMDGRKKGRMIDGWTFWSFILHCIFGFTSP